MGETIIFPNHPFEITFRFAEEIMRMYLCENEPYEIHDAVVKAMHDFGLRIDNIPLGDKDPNGGYTRQVLNLRFPAELSENECELIRAHITDFTNFILGKVKDHIDGILMERFWVEIELAKLRLQVEQPPAKKKVPNLVVLRPDHDQVPVVS